MVALCYFERHHDGLSEQKGACSGSNMNTPVSRPLYLGGDTLCSLFSDYSLNPSAVMLDFLGPS